MAARHTESSPLIEPWCGVVFAGPACAWSSIPLSSRLTPYGQKNVLDWVRWWSDEGDSRRRCAGAVIPRRTKLILQSRLLVVKPSTCHHLQPRCSPSILICMSNKLHFVALNYPALGHTRPMLGLISRLLRNNPQLTFTVIVYAPYVPFMKKELAAILGDNAAVVKQARFVGVGPLAEADFGFVSLFSAYASLPELVPAAYKTIVEEHSVTCAATGQVYDFTDLPPPSVILSDTCTPFAAQAVKAITPGVKVVVSWMATTNFFIYRLGPDSLGGFGSLEEKARVVMDEERFQGKTVHEVAAALETSFTGKPQPNAEGIEMYDYEMFPQDLDNSGYTAVWTNSAQ